MKRGSKAGMLTYCIRTNSPNPLHALEHAGIGPGEWLVLSEITAIPNISAKVFQYLDLASLKKKDFSMSKQATKKNF